MQFNQLHFDSFAKSIPSHALPAGGALEILALEGAGSSGQAYVLN